jgi:hypothetical protein
MKYLVVATLAPGVENARQGFDVFLKVGAWPGTQHLWADTAGRTFFNLTEVDGDQPPSLEGGLTYSPFFKEWNVYPIVEVDEEWITNVLGRARTNWPS